MFLGSGATKGPTLRTRSAKSLGPTGRSLDPLSCGFLFRSVTTPFRIPCDWVLNSPLCFFFFFFQKEAKGVLVLGAFEFVFRVFFQTLIWHTQT